MSSTVGRCCIFYFVLMFVACLAKNAHIVTRWADKLGTELWELANEVARPEELLEKYKSMNARVEDKSGEDLINIISENVGRMLRRKIDAVTCIQIAAEKAAESWEPVKNWDSIFLDGNFSYASSKCSPAHVIGHDSAKKMKYCNRTVKNSTTGGPEPVVVFRLRSWFIEATTCSKDMVILMDASGSMKGMENTIAKTTVSAILDTLSNNDFVAFLNFSKEATETVPCFKNMLIQATPENLDTLKKSMDKFQINGTSDLPAAFTKAFSLLETYRETRGCDVDLPCNQLIMLITDNVPGGTLGNNLKEVFKKWNWKENSTHVPVRVFTYLIGKEATMTDDVQWMVRSCLNRGDCYNVRTLEEVREQVLKYIPVVARPLVLQSVVHPIAWTHVYADVTSPALAAWLWLVMEHEEQKSRLQKYLKGKQLGVRINEDAIYIQQLHKDENIEADPSTLNTTAKQEYRLLTSVSTPVFYRKSNMTDATNDTLLGVAGTDIPIDDIRRLTLPYKLGVNGYAFIVSNNGYVILHPDLRPVYKGRLKLNYNSVDLTEVEIHDDGGGPRNPGPKLLELRSALVKHQRGNMTGVPVKLHYDDNRRINLEKRDYFYAPLLGTPFSLAVVIPNYGTTWIKVGDEIRRNQNMNVNVSDYFVGDHWRIHPSWVYCRYHYLKDHKFNSSEDELHHFLALMSRPGWRWSEQYEAYPSIDENVDEEPDCGSRTLKHDDYYCNKELMQLLVFDAKATNNSFYSDYVEDLPPKARNLAHLYGIFVRFVATQSGLTRWHHLRTSKSPGVDDGIVFGDLYKRAVNEPWYKGAIFQNELDPDSISLSVPSEAGADAIITASMSLSPKDGGKKAPAAVIGFQMPMTDFYERFIAITSVTTNSNMNCAHKWIDCYLLDQNGYVVISDAHNDTGQFMGTQEGAVMLSMVKQGLYKPVDIYDYQAWCQETRIGNSAISLMEPLQHIAKMLLWFLLRLIWFATQFVNLPGIHGKVHLDEDAPDPPPPPKPCLYHYPCDQQRTLYMLNETIAAKGITNHTDYCSRPFYAQKVVHTNLLLVVVDSMYPTCYRRLEVTPVTILPFEYTNSTADEPCHKISLNDLKKRRLRGCFTEHPLEHVTYGCGASELMVSLSLLFFIHGNNPSWLVLYPWLENGG
ncbi:voltage-dependent calcium channel subunit alpha-2/delta-3 isoform X8 [Solenopsis invicta]|uniref:voltage-dependent calcium channel subunit alpha-2/delta-3 isoform X8 n=1 Tax=Solenopsis invicta TaxID=13686 RepID=UPI00193E746C|nr:voltage-dependent calcium channel subunit alpha-2/delta-3 isoform X8 [Solenopsis invicta]